MIGLLIAFPGIAMIGVTTRRQREMIFRAARPAGLRRTVQIMGWILLAASLRQAFVTADPSRSFIEWIVGCGVISASIAIILGRLHAPLSKQPGTSR